MHLWQDPPPWRKFHPQGPQWWVCWSHYRSTAGPFFPGLFPTHSRGCSVGSSCHLFSDYSTMKIKPTLENFCRPPVLVHQLLSSLGTHPEWEKQGVLCSAVMNRTMMAPAATSWNMASGRSGTSVPQQTVCGEAQEMVWRDRHFFCAASSIGFCVWPLRRNECVVRSTQGHTMKMQRVWEKYIFGKGCINMY